MHTDKIVPLKPGAFSKPGEPVEFTWWERVKARLYVGHYGIFMSQSDTGCMSSREGHIRFTPIEEARFCRSVLALIDHEQAPSAWTFNHYDAVHNPTGLTFWIANGRSFFRCLQPHAIPLRTGTQRKLYRRLRKLRSYCHTLRHSRMSQEAAQLIGRLEMAAGE